MKRVAGLALLCLGLAGCVTDSAPQRTMLDDAIEACTFLGRPPGSTGFQRCISLYPAAAAQAAMETAHLRPAPAPEINITVEQPAPSLPAPNPMVMCQSTRSSVLCM